MLFSVKTLNSFASLLHKTESSEALERLLVILKSGARTATVKHAGGSVKSLLAALLWRSELAENHHLLVLCADKEQALNVQHDLEMLINTESVLLYAESEDKLTFNAEQLDAQFVNLTGTLNVITQRARVLIVATAPALCVSVPAPKEMKGTTLKLRRGDRHPFTEFVDVLALNGFVRKDFVETTGDMAVRGGIVDVFPPGMDNPLRIEFFGDDVDSMREFDPLSQRSIREIESAAIMTHLFHNDDHEVNATLLDYLSPETLVVQMMPEQVVSSLSAMWAKITKQEVGEFPIDEIPVTKQLQTFQTIAVNPFIEAESSTIVSLDAAFQPVFHSSVTALCSEVVHLVSQNYSMYLCSDGADQSRRLKDLVESALDAEDDGLALVGSSSSVIGHSSLVGSHELHLTNEPMTNPPMTNDRLAKSVFFMPLTLSEGFVWEACGVAVFTEHQLFMRRRAVQEKRASKADSKGITLKELHQLKAGDFVVHVDKGIAQFDGLETITMGGSEQECARLIFAGGDKMYVHLNYINRLQKFSAQEGVNPTLTKLGTGEWQRKKDRTKKRIKDIARDLIKLYAARKMQPGFAFPVDTLWQKELEASFMYEDTPDQATATAQVKTDMESSMPMDRLVCGDVGFGKTEVAIRAAFKAAQTGKQVAVLVPTTILSEQHYSSFRDRLDRYAVTIEVLSRFRSAAEQKEILKRVEAGQVDILIGTHRILSKDVAFRDLGLLVVDEEHRFGVTAKEKLRQMRVSVDTITLTATPIPRTLNFSLMGARDVSVINTPPRNRLPVKTEITVWNDHTLAVALKRELQRGGQVFFVNDRISDLPDIAQKLEELIPSIRVSIAHGQMQPEELENAMERFLERKVDVLLATKIIESGIDIPNANTMIINRADNFGLAELYQLRGRVGRSNTQAHCYLLIPPPHLISRTALRRLQAIEEFTELGSGFQLAMRDMEIRGAGNLLGAEQSGFITDIGFELYQKILDEAVQELKEDEFAELFDEQNEQREQQFSINAPSKRGHKPLPSNDDMTVDVDGDAMLPKSYIASDVERYEFYKRLFRAKNEEEITAILSEMRDRFGALPQQAVGLVDAVRLRVAGLQTGFGHVSFKNQTLYCEFPTEDHTRFYAHVFPVMMAVLSQMQEVRVIPKGKKVFVQAHLGSLDAAIAMLHRIIEQTQEEIDVQREARREAAAGNVPSS